MSVTALGAVFSWKTMPSRLRGLAALLADYHNAETGLCCPSRKTICQRTGDDERTIKRQLVELEAMGVIVREPRFIDGRQTTNNYSFAIDPSANIKIADVRKAGWSSSDSGEGGTDTPPVGGTDTPPVGGPGAPQNKEVVNKEVVKRKNPPTPLKGGSWSPPENLNVEAFDRWETYRKELSQLKKGKHPFTSSAKKQSANKLCRFPQDVQAAAIETAIDQGWISVYPESVADRMKKNGAAYNIHDTPMEGVDLEELIALYQAKPANH